MGGEDFSYMLEARPGAFVFVGNGDSAGLHNPAYDFNDEAIAARRSYWVRLVETAMPATPARVKGVALPLADWVYRRHVQRQRAMA